MIIKNSIVTRLGFVIIAVGLTFISAFNGFKFYRIILGISMAWLITGVFELGRLATLFRLFSSGKRKSLLTILMYMIIAGVCSFASINAFTTEIILKSRQGDAIYNEQISRIKEVYSKKVEGELKALNRDVIYLENQVTKYGRSKYWKRRHDRFIAKRDKAVADRDKFVNTVPKEPEIWIQANAAKLGVEIDQKLVSDNEQIALKIALKDFWGLNSLTVRKSIGVILTIAIELLIILLAANSVNDGGQKKSVVVKSMPHNHYGEKKVNRFIELSRDYFNKTGKLLPQSKLSASLRPIRICLQEYDRQSLAELFQKNMNERSKK